VEELSEQTAHSEPKELSVKIGPDRVYTPSVESIEVRNELANLLTPEIRARYPYYIGSPENIAKSTFINESGIEDKTQAAEIWEESTKHLATFNFYEAHVEKEEQKQNVTVLTVFGYEAQTDLQGRDYTGDIVSNMTAQGIDVVGVNQAEAFDADNFTQQLQKAVKEAKRQFPDNQLIIAGHSAGGFSILEAMKIMSEDQLEEFMGDVDRIRLMNTPSGTEGFAPVVKLLSDTQKGLDVVAPTISASKLHAKYLKKPQLAVSAFMRGLKEGFGGEKHAVVRGSSKTKLASADAAILANYSAEAQTGRLEEMFRFDDMLNDEQFTRKLASIKKKPSITLTTSIADGLIKYSNVIENTKRFRKAGFTTGLLFIEAEGDEETKRQKAGTLIKASGLDKRGTKMDFIPGKWITHNPTLMPQHQEIIRNFELENTA